VTEQAIPSTRPGRYAAPGAGVTLAEATIGSAWNVHGRADRAPFTYQVQAQFGVALPLSANALARSDRVIALWLGPSSWLLLGGESALSDFDARRDALNAAGGALFDVSDARVAWTISGSHAATVLAKGCPLDFHPRVFPRGTCAQSLLGHVNALYVRDADDRFTLLVARSFAHDVWRALCEAAAQYGYAVASPAAYA
jgi:sarcosine oxidase, subunit gamma